MALRALYTVTRMFWDKVFGYFTIGENLFLSGNIDYATIFKYTVLRNMVKTEEILRFEQYPENVLKKR